jgi:hypothetical protein
MELLEMQSPFLSHLQFSTEWARNTFPREYIDEKIKEANELLALLRSQLLLNGCVESSKIPCGRPWQLAIYQRSHHHQSG